MSVNVTYGWRGFDLSGAKFLFSKQVDSLTLTWWSRPQNHDHRIRLMVLARWLKWGIVYVNGSHNLFLSYPLWPRSFLIFTKLIGSWLDDCGEEQVRKREKPTESNSWCWFVGVWFTNVNKECCVSSTVISAQPWYGDDSPHLPPWIWNRTHHRGVWLPVLATHTNQNLIYDTESGRWKPAVMGQLNGCMSAPFQTCGVPLLLFVWPLYWTSKLTWVDLMIARTTTTSNQQMAGS